MKLVISWRWKARGSRACLVLLARDKAGETIRLVCSSLGLQRPIPTFDSSRDLTDERFHHVFVHGRFANSLRFRCGVLRRTTLVSADSRRPEGPASVHREDREPLDSSPKLAANR